jgi:hypothetical protein
MSDCSLAEIRSVISKRKQVYLEAPGVDFHLFPEVVKWRLAISAESLPAVAVFAHFPIIGSPGRLAIAPPVRGSFEELEEPFELEWHLAQLQRAVQLTPLPLDLLEVEVPREARGQADIQGRYYICAKPEVLLPAA